MIGLGSNRLTVCRRGGMSVTQAGRGGMEWLAGWRRPSWASPYSAQATAALKAQFPTQWPTIRDYGFAHPEIVGYMNAYAPEDAKIAYSLVEGIGTRWIVGDGTAYIKTDLWGIRNMTTEVTAKNAIYRSEQEAFTGNDGSSDHGGTPFAAYIVLRQSNILQALINTYFIRGTFTDYASKHTYKTANNKFYVDGAEFGTSNTANYDTGGWLQVFKFSSFRPLQCNISDVRFTLDKEYRLVPYKKNGALGMINLASGTFYGNANSSGSFTESIEPQPPNPPHAKLLLLPT